MLLTYFITEVFLCVFLSIILGIFMFTWMQFEEYLSIKLDVSNILQKILQKYCCSQSSFWSFLSGGKFKINSDEVFQCSYSAEVRINFPCDKRAPSTDTTNWNGCYSLCTGNVIWLSTKFLGKHILPYIFVFTVALIFSIYWCRRKPEFVLVCAHLWVI